MFFIAWDSSGYSSGNLTAQVAFLLNLLEERLTDVPLSVFCRALSCCIAAGLSSYRSPVRRWKQASHYHKAVLLWAKIRLTTFSEGGASTYPGWMVFCRIGISASCERSRPGVRIFSSFQLARVFS